MRKKKVEERKNQNKQMDSLNQKKASPSNDYDSKAAQIYSVRQTALKTTDDGFANQLTQFKYVMAN